VIIYVRHSVVPGLCYLASSASGLTTVKQLNELQKLTCAVEPVLGVCLGRKLVLFMRNSWKGWGRRDCRNHQCSCDFHASRWKHGRI